MVYNGNRRSSLSRKSRFLQMKLAPRPVTPVPDFGRHAADWWDADGPMAPLHRLNPVRLTYIRDVVCRHFDRLPAQSQSFNGLNLLDIGCGGGLVTEPITRLVGTVTGIDASAELIATAHDHAVANGLTIGYRAVLSDALVKMKKTYDVVLALEVIEHVDDPDALLRDIANLLKPGGIAIVSTPNRTSQSYLKVILAAEYLVRWVPPGTHEWQRFLQPHELADKARQHNLQPVETMGLHYDLLQRAFRLRADRLEVNYFMVLRHA